jgi:hypothetical protein
MSEQSSSIKHHFPPRGLLILPFVVFAFVSLTVGFVASKSKAHFSLRCSSCERRVSQAGTANSRRSAVLHPLGVVAHFCILVLQHIWHRSVARDG